MSSMSFIQFKNKQHSDFFLISTSAATSSYSRKPNSLVTATQHTSAIHDLKCSSSEKSESNNKNKKNMCSDAIEKQIWKQVQKTPQHDVKVKVAHDRNGEFLNAS